MTFSASRSAGWAQALLRDANCNGVLDTGEGVVSGPVATTAGTPVCLIVKVNVPTGAAVGAQNTSTPKAVFSDSNASPPLSVTLGNDDLMTLGAAGGAALALVKSRDTCNVTASPAAGASGAIGFTLTGALLPGASVQLSFAVDVASGP